MTNLWGQGKCIYANATKTYYLQVRMHTNNRSPVPKSEKEHLKETIGTIILNII